MPGETNNNNNNNDENYQGNTGGPLTLRHRSIGPMDPKHPLQALLTRRQKRKLQDACELGATVCAGIVAAAMATATVALAAAAQRGGGTRKAKRKARGTRKH